MEKRGVRDQMVIATKFTTAFRAGHGEKEIVANSSGNGSKSLHLSVAASLKKLKTDYIDLVCHIFLINRVFLVLLLEMDDHSD